MSNVYALNYRIVGRGPEHIADVETIVVSASIFLYIYLFYNI